MLTGCLGPSHTIRADELRRLASLPEAERSREVRVVQDVGTRDLSRAPETHVHPHVQVNSPVVIVARRGNRGGNTGGSSGSSSGSSGSSGSAKALAIAIVALAAFGGIILAGTEGARFEGWASTAPDHPLHLIGPDGEHYWVPISKLDPELAEWATEGVIFDDEGPFERLGRAPLNRRGFAFDLGVGASLSPLVDGSDEWAFTGGFSFGGYPIHQLGFLVGLDIPIETNVEWRLHGEVQGFPLSIADGLFEAGAYVRGGYSYGIVDQPNFEAGGLLQFGLTTRLALTIRAGGGYLFDTRDAYPVLMGGFTVY